MPDRLIPDVTVVIVNYNGGTDLLRCLAALEGACAEDEGKIEVVIVDNGSQDGSGEIAAARYSGFKLIRAGENLGFAAGCNLGLREATGRQAMLLNPDTEVSRHAVRDLCRALDENPDWGIVGPRMLDGQGVPYAAARRFPRAFDLFCECTRLVHRFPRSKFFTGYLYAPKSPVELDEVDQIEGSALMIRGDVRRKIGDLDPRFFIFFEEVDWCKRVKEAGYEIHVVQCAEVVHHRSTTMSKYYVESRIRHATSALKYFEKHHGRRGVRSLRRWMICALLIRELATGIHAMFSGSEHARLRNRGARAERSVYRNWDRK